VVVVVVVEFMEGKHCNNYFIVGLSSIFSVLIIINTKNIRCFLLLFFFFFSSSSLAPQPFDFWLVSLSFYSV
jgi:hypothetical protein